MPKQGQALSTPRRGRNGRLTTPVEHVERTRVAWVDTDAGGRIHFTAAFRWAVELFFRWFKCVLGRRHLLSESRNGVAIQVYVAIIASLLLSLWAGKKPTKRSYEMFCLYFSGWATEEELTAHLESLKDQDANSS